MLFFSIYKIILFLLFYQKVFGIKNCIRFSLLNPNKCILCDSTTYNPLYLNGIEFDICYPKDIIISYDRTVFIKSNESPTSLSGLGELGSYENPYLSLKEALIIENLRIMKEYDINITINLKFKLFFGDHFLNVMESDVNLFRNINIEISIEPLFCDEIYKENCSGENKKIRVFWETYIFFFFVSNKMIITYIHFIGKLINNNFDKKEVYEFPKDYFKLRGRGLFNIEENTDNNLKNFPVLIIDNCEFTDFINIYQQNSYFSFVFLKCFFCSVIINNCIFNNIYFYVGIIYQNFNIINSVSQIFINIDSCLFQLYKDFNIFYSLDFNNKNSIFGLYNFSGKFAVKNSIFMSNLMENSFFLNLVNKKVLNFDLLIENNTFISNTINFFLFISNTPYYSEQNVILQENSFVNNNFNIFQNINYIKNYVLTGDFSNFILPTKFILTLFTNITLKNCIFKNIKLNLNDYYLIEMNSPYTTQIFNLAFSTAEKKIYYSNDSFNIINSSFTNSKNILLVKCLFFCYQISIIDSIFKNINLIYSRNFINFNPEKIFLIKNAFFSNIKLNSSLILTLLYLKFSFSDLFIDKITIFSNHLLVMWSQTINSINYNSIMNNIYWTNIEIETSLESEIKYNIFSLGALQSGFGTHLNLTDGYFENIKITMNKVKSFILQLDTIKYYQTRTIFINITNFIAIQHNPKDINSLLYLFDCFYFGPHRIVRVIDCNDAHIDNVYIEDSTFLFGEINDRNLIYLISTSFFSLINITIEGAGSSGSFIFFQIDQIINAHIDNLRMKNLGDSTYGFIIMGTVTNVMDFLEDSSMSKYYQLKFGIYNSIFINCNNTSAIYLMPNSELFISNSIFRGLKGLEGGVLSLKNNNKVLLSNVDIENSVAKGAGGCFFLENSIIFLHKVFINITKSLSNGGTASLLYSKIVLNQCNIIDSKAKVKGGTLVLENSVAIIKETNFYLCSGEQFGGHIYVQGGNLTAELSNFIRGFSGIFGGTIFIDGSIVNFTNILVGNCSTNRGIIFIFGNNRQINYFTNMIFKDNKVLMSSVIFNNDMDLQLINCEFYNNYVLNGLIFELYGFSSTIILNFQRFTVVNNSATEGLLKAKDTIFKINNSTIISYSIRDSFFNLIDANFSISSSFSSVINQKYPKPFYFNLKRSVLRMRNNVFNLKNTMGFLLCYICLVIKLFDINIQEANNIYGAVFYLLFSNFYGNSLNLSNNKAEQGGVLFSDSSFISFKSSFFYNNIAKVRASNLKVTFGEVIMENCSFENNTKTGIHLVKSNFTINNSYFIGFKNTNSKDFQALDALDSMFILIESTNFDNFFNLSTISLINDHLKMTNIFIYNSKFSMGSSLLGGLVYIQGFTNTSIKNCEFNNGSAQKGGAIYYNCKIADKCSFKLENSIFKNNNATISGGCLQSQTIIQLNLNNTFIDNVAETGNNINYYPSKFIVFISSDQGLLLNYTKFLSQKTQLTKSILSKIPNNITLIEDEINMMPGYKYYITVFIVDKQLIIQKTETNGKVLISIFNTLSINASLTNNLVLSNQGIAYLNDIFLSSILKQIYLIEIIYSSDFSHYYYKLIYTLKVITCPVGDSIQNQLCQTCKINKYSLDIIPQEFSCKDCPSNCVCPGGNIIIPLSYFWRKDNTTEKVIKCISKAACPLQESNFVIFQCSKGYKGNVCASCDNGYGKRGFECYNCAENKGLFVGIITTGLSVIVLYCFFQILMVARNRTNEYVSLLLTKILQNHLQSFVIVGSLKFEWSAIASSFLNFINNYISTSPASVYSYDCILDNKDEYDFLVKSQIVVGFSPLILVIIMFCIKFAYQMLINLRNPKKLKEEFVNFFRKELLYQESIKHITVVYFNCFTQMLVQLLKIYGCTSIDDTNILYLTNYPFLLCHSDNHYNLIIISTVFIFFWGFMVPFIFFVNIRKRKVELLENKKDIFVSINKIEEKKQKNHFFMVTFIMRGFRIEYYYWELIILVRKAIVLFIITWVDSFENLIMAEITVIIFFIFLIFNEKCKPYRNPNICNLENVSLLTVMFSIVFTILSNFEELNSVIRYMFYLGIIIINIIFFTLWLKNYMTKMVDSVRNSRAILLKKLRDLINSKKHFKKKKIDFYKKHLGVYD